MGHTLGELLGQFDSVSGNAADTDDQIHEQLLDDGQDKTASDGGTDMNGMGSLASLFLSMTEMDKTAAAVADVPEGYEGGELTEEDLEKIATAEASELLEQEELEKNAGDGEDMMKVAAEYDAAGRIMARGFFDEYVKLANAMDTSVTDNQNSDAPSMSQTPAFGQRGLPTLNTNNAGAPDAAVKGKATPMDTSGGKEVYKGVLKPTGSKGAGDIVGQTLDQHAGGQFATVRDVMDSNR